ncbi:adenylate/guanylate cyclase domain-containing protein [Oceanospirillum beijerinckii]|uniref:adenylate/guanylate cyclase domain-containing protein n=1 Tax=Oceanospirillum beijerinckii TaxID=64976 RepID=UPI0004004A82|nr:adenylate/guanylate cyclase domain-containing protein [Oceanospirillum beijerinckii]
MAVFTVRPIGIGSCFSVLSLLRHKRWLSVLTLSITVFILSTDFTDKAWYLFFEQQAYDLKVRWLSDHTSDHELDHRIQIVDIDEYSLSVEGRWPWPRSQIAGLLEKISHNEAPVGVDVLFTDFDRLYTTDQVVGRYPFVLAQAFQFSQDASPEIPKRKQEFYRQGVLYGAVRLIGEDQQSMDALMKKIQADGYLGVTPQITKVFATGHISPIIDSDGVVRRIMPLVCYGRNCFEMLPLAMLRHMYGLSPEYQLVKGEALAGSRWHQPDYWLINDIIKIPLRSDGSLWIPYSPAGSGIAYTSATDILSDQATLNEGGFIFVGSTATSMYDRIETPLSNNYPAVEIHSVILQGLLDNSWVITPGWESHFTKFVDLLFFTVFVLALLHASRWVLPLSLLTIAAWCGVNIGFWYEGIYLTFFEPVILLLLLLMIYLPWQTIHDFREKKRLADIFKAYVPAQVFSKIESDPGQIIGLRPEKKVMTILFADVRGFTALAEKRPPEEVAKLMYRALDCMTKEIYQLEGTVDKYMGDAVMAFWGAPLSNTEHAKNAIQAACGIQRSISELSVKLKAEGGPVLEVGVGISSGEVVVGDIGSSYRHNYTVIGDAVSLAARVQKLCKEFDVDILITGDSVGYLMDADDEEFDLLPIQEISIAGRENSVEVYGVYFEQ